MLQGSVRRRECLVDVRREVLEAISVYLTHYRRLSTGMKSSRHKRIGKVFVKLKINFYYILVQRQQ